MKIKRYLIPVLLSAFVVTASFVEAQTVGSGLSIDPKIQKTRAFKPVLVKSALPPAVSLEAYTPTPGDQAGYMTSVAFAVGYHMRTMVEAIQTKTTDRKKIDQMIFSPSYIYEQVRYDNEAGSACKGRIDAEKSLDLVRDKGVATLKTVPYACGSNIPAGADAEAAQYKIKDYNFLFESGDEVNRDVKIQTLKKALSEGYPVLLATQCPPSFYNISKKGLWEVAPTEKPDDKNDKNMVVIVGYDDTKYKGAFRILNSMGSKWGDKGMAWVRYSDCIDYALFGIQVYPLEKEKPVAANADEKPMSMLGNVSFVRADGQNMPAGRVMMRNLVVEEKSAAPANGEDLVAYRMKSGYTSNTRFRMMVTNGSPAYVYAFATDLSGEIHKIMPHRNNISPLLGADNTVAYPSESGAIKMDANPGTDYLLILYSKNPLDADQLMSKMTETSGGLSAKMRFALGKELVPAKFIAYNSDEIGFILDKGAKGTVVPLMVEISHK